MLSYPTERQIVEDGTASRGAWRRVTLERTDGEATTQQTALVERHRALGARLIDFAGWEMPVQYPPASSRSTATVRAARRPVRPLAHGRGVGQRPRRRHGTGRGPGQRSAAAGCWPRPLQHDLRAPTAGSSTTSSSTASPRSGSWSCPTRRTAKRSRASCASASRAHDAAIDDASLRTSLVAVQGPRAAELLAAAHGRRPRGAQVLRHRGGPRLRRQPASSRGPATPARTGSSCSSTGMPAVPVWDALLDEGEPFGIAPCGLGARDTLRLEAGMPLYGNELDRDTNPFEAGLGRVVKLDKAGDFVGRAALEEVAANGPAQAARRPDRPRPRHRAPWLPAASCPATRPRSASSPAARRHRHSACPSPWATCRRRRPRSVPWSKSPSATRESEAEVVPLPFYKRAAS